MDNSLGEDKLALFGGTPLVQSHDALRIDWPPLDQDDRNAVISAFDRRDFSGRSSDEVYHLEDEMADAFQMPYATALNSCTAAMHAALFAIGVQPTDEVIVPNLTFIASAMAVIHAGAKPVFADVCVNSFNINVATISQCISDRTRAVIVVHMHGIPAEIEEIVEYCHSRGIVVIEDVAQAPGATYRGKRVGSFGDFSAFSLMSQKNLATCGECGILLSRTLEHKNRAESLRIYGEILKVKHTRSYNSYTIGYNYTLNPMQAAMARTQLRKFDRLTASIQSAAESFDRSLSSIKWLHSPFLGEDYRSVFHFYRLKVVAPTGQDTPRLRMAIQAALNAEGLNVRHYQNMPLSSQPVFNRGTHQQIPPHHSEVAGTEEVIRTTFVLGAIGSSPSYILCPGTLDLYLAGFAKIQANFESVLQHANEIDYQDPWASGAVISDSFKAVYEDFK